MRNLLLLVAILSTCGLLGGCVTLNITTSDGVPVFQTPVEQIRTVMAEIRALATMAEAFAVDNDFYPKGGSVALTAGPYQLSKVEDLETQLLPYGQSTSPVDPWGHPYLYWVSENRQTYVLVSTGTDGLVRDPAPLKEAIDSALTRRLFRLAQRTTCLEEEVIFVAGAFVRYPANAAKECTP